MNLNTVDSTLPISLSGTGGIGYYQVSAAGSIGYAGDAGFYSDASNVDLNHPIVGMAPTGDDGGYWLVASDGGIFNYGAAAFYGSTGGIHLNKPIVGMAGSFSSAGPNGYWLVASDGGIFNYGAAAFYGYGSAGAVPLVQPIVGVAAMPDGGGYWFTAADGGHFNYGSAPFYGRGAGQGLGQVVAMATDGIPTLQAAGDIPALRPHLRGPAAPGAGGARYFVGD